MLSIEYGRLKAPTLIIMEKSEHGHAHVDRELLVMNKETFNKSQSNSLCPYDCARSPDLVMAKWPREDRTCLL